MSRKIEFFFDCSSPWTYLAFHRIEGIAQDAQASLKWRPVLVGGVFNSVNPAVYEERANPTPVKLRYYEKDLKDWARFYGIEIGQPTIFPVNSVKAMRGCFVALEAGCLPAYARKVFEGYWKHDLDISQTEVLRSIAMEVGLDADRLISKISSAEYKAKLRASTDELIARGGYGSPTIFVDEDDMYFGNDRLVLVQHALAQ